MNGIVTDIQRFSTHDGPGIRTTVFLKGCNMHCFWCHNPETIQCKPQLRFDPSKCIGCGDCAAVCTRHGHEFTPEAHDLHRENCVACMACARTCYSGALQAVGKEMTVEELYGAIAEDEAFYRNSGGGVTLSGGEVSMQRDFAVEVLKKCKANGIHTAIESNLSMDWNYLAPLIDEVDLVMTDIKCMDDAQHMEATGVSLVRVLQNIAKLDEIGKPFIVRTPVIPDFNDSEDNITATAFMLKPFRHLQYYELLTYNPLGEEKAELVGNAASRRMKPRTKNEMRHLADIAKQYVRKVYLDNKTIE